MELIVRLRKELSEAGLDAGPETLGWHLSHDHQLTVSRSTISRTLARAGLVVPDAKKRPKSSYIRFEAVSILPSLILHGRTEIKARALVLGEVNALSFCLPAILPRSAPICENLWLKTLTID